MEEDEAAFCRWREVLFRQLQHLQSGKSGKVPKRKVEEVAEGELAEFVYYGLGYK